MRVYLETTITSYLTSRPSRDLVMAARQEITREWWETRRDHYELYISQFVLDEAGDGDANAAQKRVAILDGIPTLELSEKATELAMAILENGVLPEKAATDAFHIAVATAYEMDVLLTWNCTHLANADILCMLVRLIRKLGYEPPVICTPDELMGGTT